MRRKSESCSPMREHNHQHRVSYPSSSVTREERIDQNFRRARESCERIASVLGINPQQVLMQAEQEQIMMAANSPMKLNNYSRT